MYWFDLGHPKQARQARVIMERLGLDPLSDEVFVSARGALGTAEVARALGMDPLVIGGYYGDLYKKLVDDLYRARRLADFVYAYRDEVEVLITFGMPSGIRVAFGFQIPIVHVNDTPHNEPVRRLTAPLSDFIITPAPEAKNRLTTPPRRSLIGYLGVPEMGYVPEAERLMGGRPLELAKEIVEDWKPFVIFRYAERKASYGVGSLSEFYNTFETVYRILREHDLNLIVYQRYPDERISHKDGVFVITGDEVVNMPYLLKHAEFVISSGGTIAKEAAIQGVPALVMHYRTDATQRLANEGFPLIDARRDLIGKIYELLEGERSIEAPSLEKYDKVQDVVRKCLNSL